MTQQQRTNILLTKRKFRFSEFLAEKIIFSAALVSFIFIILIFVFVFRETLPVFGSGKTTEQIALENLEEQETYGEEYANQEALARDKEQRKNSIEAREGEATWENLTGKNWQPVSSNPKYGITPLIAGTLKVSLVAVLFAAPLGILAALFTSVFAPKWAKEGLKPAIEILAGFPSVVIGFFALVVLATYIQNIFGFEYRLNAFIGGAALSLAVIPIIYTISEDALSAIPKTLTEASLALGATQWQTALRVVLPAATPGIFAAVLLGIGRAFGETMIVLMATGNAAMLSVNPFEPVRTMSATIGAEMAEVVFGETHYNVLFLIGSILFLFTFSLNAIAELFVRRRLIKKFSGT